MGPIVFKLLYNEKNTCSIIISSMSGVSEHG